MNVLHLIVLFQNKLKNLRREQNILIIYNKNSIFWISDLCYLSIQLHENLYRKWIFDKWHEFWKNNVWKNFNTFHEYWLKTDDHRINFSYMKKNFKYKQKGNRQNVKKKICLRIFKKTIKISMSNVRLKIYMILNIFT